MSNCNYGGVLALGLLIALFIFYIAHIVSIIIRERREKDIRDRV